VAINTAGFRTPRLNLLRPRAEESMALDDQMDELGLELVGFQRWDQFLAQFKWKQGEYIALAGKPGSGKTTLARQLLPRRDFVVVMATKKSDPSLYDPLIAQGFVVQDHFDPYDREHPKIIFKPGFDSTAPTLKEAKATQREAFGEALLGIFDAEGWCVYCDEVRYLSQTLRLGEELELLFLQGRSLGISMFVGTQRPVSIPKVAWDSNHLFFWKTTDKADVLTMSEYTGINMDVVRSVAPRLPRHEALYVNTVTDQMIRTKVSL